jgi:glycosyltransferase involved in cell wall biosynthesis
MAATLQRPVTYAIPGCRSPVGWGESDIEELVELLEQVYTSPDAARERAGRAVEVMRDLSWERQIGRLYEVVRPLL